VQIWDPTSGTIRHTLSGHLGAVSALAVAPDGSWLAAAHSPDGRGALKTWNPVTGQARLTLTGLAGGVTALAVAPDSSWLALADSPLVGGATVRIWDTATGQTRHLMPRNNSSVTALVR
jgi:WD40 repeat protein